MRSRREVSASSANSGDRLTDTNSRFARNCVKKCIDTETKAWKYTLLTTTLLIFVPAFVLTIYGGITAVNLSFNKAFYGGIPATNGILVNYTARGLIWQGVKSRSACLLLNFISCSEFRNNVATNSSCARDGMGMMLTPEKCDSTIGDGWIANGSNPVLELYDHQCWSAGGGTSSPFLQGQFMNVMCSRTHLPARMDGMPLDLPNQRSSQVVLSICQAVLSFVGTVMTIAYLFVKRSSILDNFFVPFLVIISLTIIFTAINGKYITNLRFISGSFTDCKGMSSIPYAGEFGDCKESRVANLGSRGTPDCIRKQPDSLYVSEEAELQSAPSAFCNTDSEGNYEDVLSKEFVVAVHCYLAGTVLVLFVTVLQMLILIAKDTRAGTKPITGYYTQELVEVEGSYDTRSPSTELEATSP